MNLDAVYVGKRPSVVTGRTRRRDVALVNVDMAASAIVLGEARLAEIKIDMTTCARRSLVTSDQPEIRVTVMLEFCVGSQRGPRTEGMTIRALHSFRQLAMWACASLADGRHSRHQGHEHPYREVLDHG
jgi:hypothetical protein